MMLTAIPASHSSSVFAHNHTPAGSSSTSLTQSVISPDSSPEERRQQHQHQGQASLHRPEGRVMDGSSKLPLPVAGHGGHGQPHIIPVHQSFILGAGGATGYILPSITQLSSLPSAEGAMVGIQPLTALPSVPRPMPIQSTQTAVPAPVGSSGFYGQVHDDSSCPPLTFQPQIPSSTAPDQRVIGTTVGPSIPPPALTAVASSRQQVVQQLQLTQHPHTVPARPMVLNGSHQSDITAAPSSLRSARSPDIGGEDGSVRAMPLLSPLQQPQNLSQPHSLLDTTNISSATASTISSNSSSSPSSDSTHHHQIEHQTLQDQQQQQQRARKRLPHHDLDIAASYARSRAARQATRFNSSGASSTSADDSVIHSVRVKREPEDSAASSHLSHSTRRNSDSNLEEAVGSSSKSYQISALIDVPPMASALSRASRTSSLSSSLSSFRFGGSLSQLWASQISMGKINDMKSTGNLTAEAAVLPSLGNQYFALGGSLPELSLTSLTRLLPNSSANEPSHGLVTVPLYVYSSQQHLATPIINSHGSITFGSFLSTGPNLCSSSKGSPNNSSNSGGGGGSRSSVNDVTDGGKKEVQVESSVGRSADSTTKDDGEDQIVDVGHDHSGIHSSAAVQAAPVGSSSTPGTSLQDSIVKVPAVYSPLSASLLSGVSGVAPGVITTLPTFGMLARAPMESNLSPSDRPGSIIMNNRAPSMTSSLPTSSSLSTTSNTIEPPLGGHIIHQLHSQQPQAQIHITGNHAHPLTLPLSNPPHSHLHSLPSPNCQPDKSHLHAMSPPTQSDLYLPPAGTAAGGPSRRDGGSAASGGESMLQQVHMPAQMNSIKLESDMELDYEHALNIHPIIPHDQGPGGVSSASLHSPPSDQQVMDQHMLQGGSGMIASDGSAMGMASAIKKEKDKPYKCDQPGCGRTFSFPAHLRSHVQQIHISYRPCKCEFPGCGKRFYTPQHLNVHRRVHTGERPFVCPYADCSKAFTTAGNLKNHIRTHTGERPYACKFEGCSKRFAEMSSLKKHELTHTGEKPYKCRVCGKAFSQAGSRNTHERKHNRSEEEEMSGVGPAAIGESAGLSKGSKKYRIRRISGGNSSEDSIMSQP